MGPTKSTFFQLESTKSLHFNLLGICYNQILNTLFYICWIKACDLERSVTVMRGTSIQR